ncbi:hypothetical protein [Amycolatopsis sp. NPDC049159]|uniref:hypothetical protein n=1 Tax=Amycolatopsis sp. NPDC049159 TaxID=3157210 RepID=UPI0033C2A3AA
MTVLALALAQFAATTMTVAVGVIAADIGTTVIGDDLGRKRCFLLDLVVYGAGADDPADLHPGHRGEPCRCSSSG